MRHRAVSLAAVGLRLALALALALVLVLVLALVLVLGLSLISAHDFKYFRSRPYLCSRLQVL